MPQDVAARLAALTVDPAGVALPVKPAGADDAKLAALPQPRPDALSPIVLSYTTTIALPGGQEMAIQSEQRLAPEAGGGGLWKLEAASQGPMGAAKDTVLLHAHSLQPVHRSAEQGPAKVEIDYAADSVKGKIQAGPQEIPIDLPLDAPVLSDGSALEVFVAALPLAPGYRTTLRTFELNSQKVRPWSLEVTGTETVEVPAGKFDAFRVEMKPLDGQTDASTLWVAKDAPRAVVRMEGQLPAASGGLKMTTVLTGTKAAE